MFYYFNGRLPLTNGLLIVPDGDVPEGTEKINLKLFYEMFKDTESHGLVSIQFLGALMHNMHLVHNIFWVRYFNIKICTHGTL